MKSFRGDWTALRETAQRIQADRLRGDAAAVEGGALDADVAATRGRVADALVMLWLAVERREDIPTLPAHDAEIRADLAKASAGAAQLAAARPQDSVMARYAALIATLAEYHEPISPGGSTLIAFCHTFNQENRARRALEKAA